jgi:hypothetical protein
MATIFGYYFIGVFAFSFLSAMICLVYGVLITHYMSANFPNELRRSKILSGYSSPIKAWKILRGLKDFGDDKLNRLANKALFWFLCCNSLIITAPLGGVIYIILIALFGRGT